MPTGYPPILTTAQAAELLQVHVEYLRKMVREDRIPAHRFPGGREIRFIRDELIAWVREQPGHDRSPVAPRSAPTSADRLSSAGSPDVCRDSPNVSAPTAASSRVGL